MTEVTIKDANGTTVDVTEKGLVKILAKSGYENAMDAGNAYIADCGKTDGKNGTATMFYAAPTRSDYVLVIEKVILIPTVAGGIIGPILIETGTSTAIAIALGAAVTPSNTNLTSANTATGTFKKGSTAMTHTTGNVIMVNHVNAAAWKMVTIPNINVKVSNGNAVVVALTDDDADDDFYCYVYMYEEAIE